MVSTWRRVDDNAAPARAKITGIYVNSALAKTEAMDNGFDEAIVLTLNEGTSARAAPRTSSSSAEAPWITPPVSDDILEGVTRKVLMKLAREDLGLPVIERSLDRSELYVADEVFSLRNRGPGLASHRYRPAHHRATGAVGPVTKALQDLYFDICKGRVEEKLDWLTPVY